MHGHVGGDEPGRGGHRDGRDVALLLDHVLAILAPTDLHLAAKMELVALLTGMVANYARHEVAQVELTRRTGRTPAESAAAEIAYLAAAASSGRYPHLAAAFAQRPQPPAVRDADPFDHLIRRVLAGLLTPPR